MLAATEVVNGKQLRVTQLVKTEFDPKEEKDAPEVYVSQLVFDAKAGMLLATDERQRHWRISPADGSAELMGNAQPVK